MVRGGQEEQDYNAFCSTLSAVASMAAASLAMEDEDLADSTTPPPQPFTSGGLLAAGLAGNGTGGGGGSAGDANGGSVEGDFGPNGELLGLNGHQHEKKTPNSIRGKFVAMLSKEMPIVGSISTTQRNRVGRLTSWLERWVPDVTLNNVWEK